jgi:hypothetical protein
MSSDIVGVQFGQSQTTLRRKISNPTSESKSKPSTKQVAYFMLASCFSYFSTLKMEAVFSSKHYFTFTRSHGVISSKTELLFSPWFPSNYVLYKWENILIAKNKIHLEIVMDFDVFTLPPTRKNISECCTYVYPASTWTLIRIRCLRIYPSLISAYWIWIFRPKITDSLNEPRK